jgi:hypothetical protein
VASNHPFNKIHNINQRFNKFFDFPLYFISILILLLFFFSSYHIRILISFLINILFNRPIVYLNYLSRFFAKPIQIILVSILYLLLFGTYSLFLKIFLFATFFRKPAQVSTWVSAEPHEIPNDLKFQS